eukprot:gnl/MRDRNA2_/MRDRNA2_97923_c0_seq1.p1 gnl/MRDRNA2_/MRDRNA2_97923_c0~~gnl/MRDRNA2_/MRDRNA2_97923_c0_seq1.p1  ORF type:complete len:233 (-),score=43.02 gnl/MRDRNA2_/MRDRNA2_97923_c0_seq1:382-1080(-)
MKEEAHLQCAARSCHVQDRNQLYRIGYCGGFGKGQGAKVVEQRKKGMEGTCKAISALKDGLFRRGDVVCPLHMQQIKEIYMFTAHPVQKATASEKQALAQLGLPSTRYCIGTAPTSRGSCRECNETIEEGSLRFGIEHRFGAHYEARWRHWECAKDTDLDKALANGAWAAVPGFNELSSGQRRIVLSSRRSSGGKVASKTAKFQNLKKRPAGSQNPVIDLCADTSSKKHRNV